MRLLLKREAITMKKKKITKEKIKSRTSESYFLVFRDVPGEYRDV